MRLLTAPPATKSNPAIKLALAAVDRMMGKAKIEATKTSGTPIGVSGTPFIPPLNFGPKITSTFQAGYDEADMGDTYEGTGDYG